MQVNLITMVFDLGIVEEIKKASNISNAFAFRFVKRLLDEYGVSRVNADWGVSVWCVCYGKQLLHKHCEIEISQAKSGSAPSIRDEKSSSSGQYNDLFQYKANADGYGISGFTSDSIRTLIIPNKYKGKPITRILSGAFEGCLVQEVVMTDGVSVIEAEAFKSCKNLKQVIFPGTLKEIGDAAFSECSSLITAALPVSVSLIGSYAFKGTAIKQIQLPDSILWIGEGAYKDCSMLTSAFLPKNIIDLPIAMFQGCKALKKMDLPESVCSIGREAFSGCTSLLDMIIPASVTNVGDNAFAGMNPTFCLICTQGSAAEQYARKHNLPFQIVL